MLPATFSTNLFVFIATLSSGEHLQCHATSRFVSCTRREQVATVNSCLSLSPFLPSLLSPLIVPSDFSVAEQEMAQFAVAAAAVFGPDDATAAFLARQSANRLGNMITLHTGNL